MGAETNLAFLQPLLKCYEHSIKAIGGPESLSQELNNSFVEVISHQLETISDIRKDRSRRHDLESAGGAMVTAVDLEYGQVQAETLTLDDMEELLRFLDPRHPLLEGISNVRGMRHRASDSLKDISIGNLEGLVLGTIL